MGITNLELAPSGPANPRALELIKNAQAIVFGPGDIYTSTVPNLLVDGVREAIAQSKAKKILVVNLMTKWGQTNGYKASDFVNGINRYLLPASIETVIVNTKQLEPAVIERYKQEKAEPIDADIATLEKIGVKVVAEALAATNTFEKDTVDQLKRSFLRHDSERLAKIIYNLVNDGN